MANDLNDIDLVTFDELDVVGDAEDSDKFLLKTADGVAKTIMKSGLFHDEATTRAAADDLLQGQITSLLTDLSGTGVAKKGVANGLAELDGEGKVPTSQLPSYVDDVVEGYYNDNDGKFYKTCTETTVTHDIWSDGSGFINSDTSAGTEPAGTAGTPVALGTARTYVDGSNVSYYQKDNSDWYKIDGLTTSSISVLSTAESDPVIVAALEAASDLTIYYIEYTETTRTYSEEITPEKGKVYTDLRTNLTYRWSGSAFVKIASDLALGETSSTAYRGDRGKIAYDHSQARGTGVFDINTNPHALSPADIGLGNVPNVTTNNQTPTFTATVQNQELNSGETLTVLFGKLKKVVKSFIDHINTSISTNPHNTTKANVGLGDVENYGRDTVVISGSNKYITSGAVFTALLSKANKNETLIGVPQPSLSNTYLKASVSQAVQVTVYTDGTNFFNADGTATTEPSGTAGTPTSVGDFVNYSGTMYKKVSTDYYMVATFTDAGTLVTDASLIAALNLATFTAISSVVYTGADSVTYSWGQGGGVGVSFIGTQAQYDVAKLIPVGSEGHIPSGSLVIITDKDSKVMGKEVVV